MTSTQATGARRLQTGYPLGADPSLHANHRAHLGDLFDAVSLQHAKRLLPSFVGATVLDVGAGDCRFAYSLAQRVQSAGRVVAIDRDPGHIAQHPRLRVLAYELGPTTPLPDSAPFDLIHARLVLSHLTCRTSLVARLANALAPGGVFLTADFTPSADVLLAPSDADATLLSDVQRLITETFQSTGTNTAWNARVAGEMATAGLDNIGSHTHQESWRGGSPGALLARSALHQLRDRPALATLGDAAITRALALYLDPRVLLRGHALVYTWGHKPHSSPPEVAG